MLNKFKTSWACDTNKEAAAILWQWYIAPALSVAATLGLLAWTFYSLGR